MLCLLGAEKPGGDIPVAAAAPDIPRLGRQGRAARAAPREIGPADGVNDFHAVSGASAGKVAAAHHSHNHLPLKACFCMLCGKNSTAISNDQEVCNG